MKTMTHEDAIKIAKAAILLTDMNEKYGGSHGKNWTGIIMVAYETLKKEKKNELVKR